MPKISVADRAHPVAPCFEKHIAVFQNRIRRKNRKPVGLHRISGKILGQRRVRKGKQRHQQQHHSFHSVLPPVFFFLFRNILYIKRPTRSISSHIFPPAPPPKAAKRQTPAHADDFASFRYWAKPPVTAHFRAATGGLFVFSVFLSVFQGKLPLFGKPLLQQPFAFIRRSQRNPRRRYPVRRSYRRAKIWRCPSCPRR